MRHALCFILTLGLTAAAGCDDGTDSPDGGDSDSGTRDGGGDEAGVDGGGDTDGGDDGGGVDGGDTDGGGADGGTDAGTDAGPPPVMASRLTVYIGTAILTFPVVDAAGMPLLLDTAAAFDHDLTPGDTIFGSESMQRTLAVAVGGNIEMRFPLAWVDGGGVAVAPDLLFRGALGAGAPALISVEGTQARLYNFTTDTFGAQIPLTDTTAAPFDPSSATTVRLGPALGNAIYMLRDGADDQIYFVNSSAQLQAAVTPARCSDATSTISAEHILGATIAGFTPPGGADSVFLIAGSNLHFLQSVSPTVCFSDPVPLQDQFGGAVTPDIAFGFDFNGDMTDDLVAIDTVTVP